ncbi:MAG: T9SS type A sorting domain-containing protein [Candidatus Eisenbacteria bacterium]|nr:T9SS type A sorting domain-containing protein [Candidatus Eisenbacteria bacterium]
MGATPARMVLLLAVCLMSTPLLRGPDGSALAAWYDEGSWDTGFHGGLDGPAYAAVWYDGALVVAGNFTSADGFPAANIAAWNGDSWTSLGAGIAGERVSCLTIWNGNLYAGGSFTRAGDEPADNVAYWDGGAWHPLTGGGTDGVVLALAGGTTRLFVAGNFAHAGGLAAARIASYSGAAWETMGSGMNAPVCALAASGTTVYAGGEFTSAGGNAAAHAARWSGSAWSALGAGCDGPVRALELDYSSLYVGGAFSHAGGVAAANIAVYVSSTWFSLGAGLEDPVDAIVIHDGYPTASNGHWLPGGQPEYRVSQWRASAWHALGDGTWNDATAALVSQDHVLYAAGLFSIADDGVCPYLAHWQNGAWTSPCSLHGQGVDGPSMFGVVSTFVEYDSALVAAGNIEVAGGVPVNYVAKWTGSDWEPLGQGLWQEIPGYGVKTCAVYKGELYIGGSFSFIDEGVLWGGLARWDGTQWRNLGEAGAWSLALWNGYLVAAGSFALPGTPAGPNVGLWDGSSWRLISEQTFDSSLTALLVYQDQLVVCGHFRNVGGTPINRVARWDGNAWRPFGSGIDDVYWDEGCYCLAEYEGEVIVGGLFRDAGGQAVNNVARWDGSIWQPMRAGFNFRVDCLNCVQGELMAGGEFAASGGESCRGLARWDGTRWVPFGGALNGSARALHWSDGVLWVGGSFSMAGDVPSLNVALWTPNSSDVPIVPGSSMSLVACPIPFIDRVRIAWSAPGVSTSRVSVLDVNGRVIASFAGKRDAPTDILWDGRAVDGSVAPAGMYWLRLNAAETQITRRIVRIR